MYSLIRPLLFRLDPESSHDLVMSGLAKISRNRSATALANKLYGRRVPQLTTRVMGIDFPNPVGLAAGLDKQGHCANGLAALGFGWVELGTVTPLPQPGNPRPRMFRLEQHGAIINRMGFNSVGLAEFISNVSETSPGVIKGINIGKNAATPLERAAEDYVTCLDAAFPHADYIAVNISSPNTENLRSLQQDQILDALLGTIHRRRLELTDQVGRAVPLVLKIAPDVDDPQIDAIAKLLRKHAIDGVAATNTTISREGLGHHIHASETGGLSGRPLRNAATSVIEKLFANLQGEVPIIGIGGIDSASAAVEKFTAGADLIQLYTGFIYQGPNLIRQIVSTLQSLNTSGIPSSLRRELDRT